MNDHPGVHILTATIDPEIDDKKYIIPGLGDFGDRYFASSKAEEVNDAKNDAPEK